MKLTFNKTYFIIFIFIFFIEFLIAVYLKTGFIRHTFGDFLATILLYSFVKSFFDVDAFKLAFSVLVFAFLIEFLQLFNILELLNIKSSFLKIVFGTTFQFTDLVAYTLGLITVLLLEFKIYKLWI